MQSLAVKFTLAFLIVGIMGSLLVALFMYQQTEQAFDNFRFDPLRITPTLAGYYAATGDWEGIDVLLAVEMDADRMTQVLDNLVDNAIRYTAAGGTISLRARLSANQNLLIDVSDTGTGIAAEHLPHNLNRFYQVDQSRSRDNSSSSLGLAIAKSIVEAHDGHLAADSQLGEGTNFAVTLPIDPLTPRKDSAEPAPSLW